MIKVKLNADLVIENFKRTLDLTQNFIPYFNVILGDDAKSQPWTIRGATARIFASKTSPAGAKWPDLSPKYQKQKSKMYPGAPMLVATGELFRSVTSKDSQGSVVMREPKKMIFGTAIEYANFHQMGTEKMPKREFLGVTDKQKKTWNKLLKEYMNQSIRGRDPSKIKTEGYE